MTRLAMGVAVEQPLPRGNVRRINTLRLRAHGRADRIGKDHQEAREDLIFLFRHAGHPHSLGLSARRILRKIVCRRINRWCDAHWRADPCGVLLGFTGAQLILHFLLFTPCGTVTLCGTAQWSIAQWLFE
jgi:hypothetical protein